MAQPIYFLKITILDRYYCNIQDKAKKSGPHPADFKGKHQDP